MRAGTATQRSTGRSRKDFWLTQTYSGAATGHGPLRGTRAACWTEHRYQAAGHGAAEIVCGRSDEGCELIKSVRACFCGVICMSDCIKDSNNLSYRVSD